METIEINKATRILATELPEKVQGRIMEICVREGRNFDYINFKPINDNMMMMMDGNAYTGWNYFIEEEEID